MSLEHIKRISIREYLGARGIKPQSERAGRAMYLSPFRQERTASFSVNYDENVWYDHGIGEGGSIIDLVARMGLYNHQWIACTHKDTGKPHIHLIANRIGVDGKVFNTTFMSNRSARIAEELSRDMGLTIANEVRAQKKHREVHADPDRQQAKDRLQRIAYSELKSNTTLADFLHGLERKGVGIEPAKNKQGNIYGIRFSYEGHTFKASEIGREFGYHSLAGNFSSSPEPGRSPQVQHLHDTGHANTPRVADHHFSLSEGAAALFGSLFSPSLLPAEDDNAPSLKKKKRKKLSYGRQQS